jgi:phenylacetic acid degradation operon negative regulatory protein
MYAGTKRLQIAASKWHLCCMDDATQSASRALDALIARLHRRGRLRVWSLVVTMFGDMIVPRGGRVALAVLQEIAARIGVEPGALRTAMSRLAAEGWVVREREGRNSYYRLAEGGRHAFDLATRRIYAGGPPAWNGSWTVLISPSEVREEDAEEAAALGFVRVSGRAFLRPETEGAPAVANAFPEMLVVHGAGAEHPETILSFWPSAETAEAYRTFIGAFAPLHAALDRGETLEGLDAVAARTLLIHDWRRIVLRDPGLPTELLPGDWPGEEARALARRIYAALVGPSEAWLDEAELPVAKQPRLIGSRLAPRRGGA